MYSNHRQAETTGVVIGRRQGHQAGYTEGWNAAVAACEKEINDLQAALNAMFVLAYPALTALHHANDRNAQDFFVQHYTASIQKNAATLRNLPHKDPRVLAFDPAIHTVVSRWIAAANSADNSPSP